MSSQPGPKRPVRWHIAVFLAPALLIYTAIMIVPLAGTLQLSLYRGGESGPVFAGLQNFADLLASPQWSEGFRNALWNNVHFFIIHMLVQIPVALLLAALLSNPRLRLRGFYRTAIFVPAILSFVVAGLVWKLILSPLWGVTPDLLDLIGLKALFAPWLGDKHHALTTLALISAWKLVGIPMMLIHAALLSIPDDILDAAECDGLTGPSLFRQISLPLIWPTIGVVCILTFIWNFSAFDLVYAVQGQSAGPDFSTDILGTFLYRTAFGTGTGPGDPHMGAAVASMMVFIILAGTCLYLFAIQRRLPRYRF